MSKIAIFIAALVLLVALAACAPAPTPVPTAAPPTAAPKATTAAPTTAAPTVAAATKAPEATKAATAAATTAPTVAATTAPTTAAATKAPAATGSIRIGIIAPTTGNFASNGQSMIDGWKLWWDKNGYTVAGRKVEMFYEDDAANSDTTLSKARLLVEQRQVHMVIGPLSAATGLALAGYAKTTPNIPYFYPIVSADDLTQRARLPNIVRIAGWTSSQTTHPLGEWAFKQGYKKAVTIGADFAFGHETVAGFARTFSESGGAITSQIWHPIGAPDFAPYIAQIQAAAPDVVFAQESGGDTVKFVKAWSDFGLKGKIPLLVNQTATDQSGLSGMGPEAEGLISVGHYAEGRDDPTTQAFVKDFDAAYKKLPSYYAADMYTAAGVIAAAIGKVNGNVEDSANFIKVVLASDLSNTPMGPQKMDSYGNPVQNVYLRKVEKRSDGRLWNVVTFTWPNVSQFWTYKPEDFLKNPVYSRDFQGIKK
jgi:branched-chain amino acid transport system substrate-binding protein